MQLYGKAMIGVAAMAPICRSLIADEAVSTYIPVRGPEVWCYSLFSPLSLMKITLEVVIFSRTNPFYFCCRAQNSPTFTSSRNLESRKDANDATPVLVLTIPP
jgi:hypothetical protein